MLFEGGWLKATLQEGGAYGFDRSLPKDGPIAGIYYGADGSEGPFVMERQKD